MFATLKTMLTRHQTSVARDRRRGRHSCPAVEGLEQRRVLSVSTPVVAVLAAPAPATAAPAQIAPVASPGIIIIQDMGF